MVTLLLAQQLGATFDSREYCATSEAAGSLDGILRVPSLPFVA
jgi:hypothetical protein